MKHCLVTGATGAIGSRLVPLLLAQPGVTVPLLLRANSDLELERKLANLFEFWGIDAADTETRARIRVFRGDVRDPRLGLDEEAYRTLCGEVTHIIHCAGDIRPNQPLEDARRIAVDSARAIAALAEAARRAGQFRKLEFVSSIAVSGRTRGPVAESLPYPAPGFRTTYEQAKSEAEAFIFSRIEAGLPATVHRPSMVVGDSATGKIIHPQFFYPLAAFLSGLQTAGIVPATGETRLDIIPVDYVARALLASSDSETASGRVFHLCSGPEHAPRIVDLVARLREIYRRHRMPVPRLIKLPLALYRILALMAARFAPPQVRTELEGLPLMLEYLADGQVFETAETGAFFSPLGITVPGVGDYLDHIMDTYLKSPSPATPGP